MMKLIQSIFVYGVSEENEKFYRTTQKAYYLGLISHSAILIIFYLIEIPEIMMFNLFISIPFFTIAIVINHNGKLNTAFSIASFELYFHQVVGMYYLGWDFGFQFWLIYLVALGFFNPTWGKKIQRFQLALYMFTVIIMYIYFKDGVYHLDPLLKKTGFLINAVSTVIILSLLINGYSKSAYYAEENLKRANIQLQKAHRETRKLLLNILPESIANRLSDGEKIIAESVDEASVLFCDLTGFTEISSSRSAEEIVSLLNGIFYEFDSIVEDMKIEKIKTIGDGYMVAAGIPKPDKDHAIHAVECGLRMLNFMKQYAQETQIDLKLRIGISSGHVVAGVIGKNKFSYDIWGDSVNTASRMESHGIPGKIHISKSTYEKVKDYFKVEHRGKIKIKGKGEMDTYLIAMEFVKNKNL